MKGGGSGHALISLMAGLRMNKICWRNSWRLPWLSCTYFHFPQFQSIEAISSSLATSASLPPLAPAPSLHRSTVYESHLHHHPPPLYPPRFRTSTVYRNPYDIPDGREFADALRTQDNDMRVRQLQGDKVNFELKNLKKNWTNERSPFGKKKVS